MSVLRLRLMHREGLERLNDAEVLAGASAIRNSSNSAHLLSLLGLELLLKLVYEVSLDSRAHGHKYDEIFLALPPPMQETVLKNARARIGPSALDTDADVRIVLREWSENFVALRYPYERYEGMTEAQYQRLGAEWIAKDSPLKEATFRYYPEELFGMLHALRAVANDMANTSFKRTQPGTASPSPAGPLDISSLGRTWSRIARSSTPTADSFFHLRGSGVMKLAPAAAAQVCVDAAARGILIVRVEGGDLAQPGVRSPR